RDELEQRGPPGLGHSRPVVPGSRARGPGAAELNPHRRGPLGGAERLEALGLAGMPASPPLHVRPEVGQEVVNVIRRCPGLLPDRDSIQAAVPADLDHLVPPHWSKEAPPSRTETLIGAPTFRS